MKSRIVRKIFTWNLLIFILLLLLQLVFQNVFFASFLSGEQSRKLVRSMESIQDAILLADNDLVHRQINDLLAKGMVIVTVDQNMQHIYGQNFDGYQRYFTMEEENGNQYSIIEDYLGMATLQNIEVGDVVTVEGYLVDERNALVIPSKVHRPSDGIVLGTDTFLFINHANEIQHENAPASFRMEIPDDASPETGVAYVEDASVSSTVGGGAVTQNAMVGRVVDINDDSDLMIIPETVTQTASTSKYDTQNSDAASTVSISVDEQPDEKSLPSGFALHSPFDADMSLSGSLSSNQNNAIMRSERMLVINDQGRSGSSYPVSINGRIVLKTDAGNDDLIIQQGLINNEIKRLAAAKKQLETVDAYTVTNHLTTGMFLVRVSRLAQGNTIMIGAISLYAIRDMNNILNMFHFLIFLAELGLLMGAVYFFSRIISRPLVEMNTVAQKISQQDFGALVKVTSKDEVGTLGVSINKIAVNLEQRINQINAINDRLQKDYERQVELQQRHKHLSASFSHELKTPLTIVRGYIDSIQNGIYPKDEATFYAAALRSLDTASNLITQMLEIARMESPYFALRKSAVDLWMVFFKVYDQLKLAIEERNMRVQYTAEDEAYTVADVELMESVFANALTNAMKYSPEGSRIIVRITTKDAQHSVSIENENGFIPPEALEKIWQPFYRGAQPQLKNISGTGLGLMIVSEILDAHGFAYGIANTGNGVAFSFSCPAVQYMAEPGETFS